MGLILGRISVETPKYEVVHTAADYEIRRYPAAVLAEVTYDPAQLGGRDAGFMILAKYIGAVGNPQNAGSCKIAMTAPVLTSAEQPAMTMQFVLPSKFVRAEDAPRPADERVRIRDQEGDRKYGVVRFSGVATDTEVAARAEKLRKSLERDGYVVVGDRYVLARYNPPWTLPPLRTNEVMLPVA
ncbi:hypothetical protein HPP92_013915 [Vanilla planifolia]|uniref:SOUL heme-binding protein n=1 Tax=Vanilla planifolia TaxID=51239 RepID=A0A835QT71_VANPL|nr:hypothetical protein HPP92_013915 [Vanilla planifolia]